MSFKHLLEMNIRYRWIVVGIFFAFTIVCAFQLPKLKFDFNPESMLEFSEEEIEYQQQFEKKFSSNSDVFLVVMSDETSLMTPSGLGDLHELTEALSEFEGVSKTYSLTRVPQADNTPMALIRGLKPLVGDEPLTEEEAASIRERVQGSSLLRGNLISADEHDALIMVYLKPDYVDPDAFYPVLEKIQSHVAAWQAKENDDNAKYSIGYGGLPYIRAMTVDSMKRDQFILWPVVGVLYILALCILFRSFWQAILPLVSVGCVVLWAIAIMVWAGIPVTMINNTLPLLILVIGVTNGIYVLMRILDERKKGKDKKKALVDGVYRVALATFLTTTTTAVGFGSLAVARTTILNSFGVITAIAVMLVYVAIIFLMPQIASFIKLDPKREKSADAEQDGLIEKFVGTVTNFSINHKILVTIGSVALLGGCIFAGCHVEFNSHVNDVFQEDHPITQTNLLIENKLGGMLPLEIDIKTTEEQFFGNARNMKTLCDLQSKIVAHDGVISALSICDMFVEAGLSFDNVPDQKEFAGRLFAMNRVQGDMLKQYMTPERNNVHITVRIPDNGVQNSNKTISDLDAMCKAAFDGTAIDYRLTGIAYNSTRGLDMFVGDLFTSLLMAFMIIFVVLFVAFRSFWSGIVTLIPNLLPLCMTLAIMPLYGYGLNTTSVLVFTISIGLAVDNSIHIIQRFRQEYRYEKTVPDAIRIAMRSSGRAICQSNVLLCSGLAVLLISNFEPITRVGILTMTTIGSALVISLIVLPAELAIVGHKMKLPRFIAAEKKLACDAQNSSDPNTHVKAGTTSDADKIASKPHPADNEKDAKNDARVKPISSINPALAGICITPKN